MKNNKEESIWCYFLESQEEESPVFYDREDYWKAAYYSDIRVESQVKNLSPYKIKELFISFKKDIEILSS